MLSTVPSRWLRRRNWRFSSEACETVPGLLLTGDCCWMLGWAPREGGREGGRCGAREGRSEEEEEEEAIICLARVVRASSDLNPVLSRLCTGIGIIPCPARNLQQPGAFSPSVELLAFMTELDNW